MKTLLVSFVLMLAGVEFVLWYQSAELKVLGLLWVAFPHALTAMLGYVVEKEHGKETQP